MPSRGANRSRNRCPERVRRERCPHASDLRLDFHSGVGIVIKLRSGDQAQAIGYQAEFVLREDTCDVGALVLGKRVEGEALVNPRAAGPEAGAPHEQVRPDSPVILQLDITGGAGTSAAKLWRSFQSQKPRTSKLAFSEKVCDQRERKCPP